MPQKTKFAAGLTIFILLFFTSFFWGLKISKAEKCDPSTEDCHSLRPFPGVASDEEVPLTQMCGDSIVFQDSITKSILEGNCGPKNAKGIITCSYSVPRKIEVNIDLSEAKLPIMGNTEDVINRQTTVETIDDAEKTNEYVSWYLNGVINRAEYPALDPSNPADQRKIIDFSGPLRKLLPWEIQLYPKIKLIKQAFKGETANQIVGCTALGKIVPCYGSGINDPKRLADWYTTGFEKLILDPFNSISKTLLGIIEWSLESILQIDVVPLDWLKSMATHWDDRRPPLRENFDNFKDYWVNYKEWRGRACTNVLGVIFCIDTPFRANYWADLFPNIPFSSTEDKEGSVEFIPQQQSNPGVTITNLSLNEGSLALYFAHMEETLETANLLQQTYSPKNIQVTPVNDITPVDISSDCKILETRSSGGGDSLYPSSDYYNASITYTASFSCDFDFSNVQNTQDYYPTCNRKAKIQFSTKTSTPLADEVWSKLVADSNSVFRRIFPKTGAGTPVASIKDIPASSTISYTSPNLVGEQTGNLYFAHIGGISEYFLKGIQTALRPKGYGEFVSPGVTQPEEGDLTTNVCSNTCNKNPTQVNMEGVKERFIDVSSRWLLSGMPRIELYDDVVNKSLASGVDPIFTLSLWIHESGASNYYGICQVMGGGDPNAGYCQRIQDFGINKPELETQINSQGNIIKDNFAAQLNNFVGLPGYYLDRCGTDVGQCPLEMWIAIYWTGECTPTEAGNRYMASIQRIYQALAPTQAFPCYPSKLP